jgi:dihydroorotate dehydrogenase (NAD+) catalytic subunit
VETASGMLNSIGLDNDGIETFIQKHLPYLLTLEAPVFANIAGRTIDDFAVMAAKLNEFPRLAGLELNISCPNVSGGVDFGTNPDSARKVVEAVRQACSLPIITKLTPNVTDIVSIARAAADGGTDAVSLVNTFQGMAVNWKQRKAVLGNVLGGLSGPAIKPLALRCVYQVARSVSIPIIGVGGISNIDDVMEFLVAGASAIQVGTASFFQPGLSSRLPGELHSILEEQKIGSVSEIVGTLQGLPKGCGT